MNRVILTTLLFFIFPVQAYSSCINQELASGFEGTGNDNMSDIFIEGPGHSATFSGGSISEPDPTNGIFKSAWFVASMDDLSSGHGLVTLNPSGIFVEFDYLIEGDAQANLQLLDSGTNVIYERTVSAENGKFSFQLLDGDAMINRVYVSIVGGSGGINIDNFYYYGTTHLEPCNDVATSRSGGTLDYAVLFALLLLISRTNNLTSAGNIAPSVLDSLSVAQFVRGFATIAQIVPLQACRCCRRYASRVKSSCHESRKSNTN